MYKLKSTRYPELFRLEIADQAYLISKEGISTRTEIICHKEFTRQKMKNGEAIHLNFQGSFLIGDKLLEVNAIYKTSFGPLGDRMLFDIEFDGKRIGNIRALYSYMGGGVNGTWPLIHSNEKTVLFTLNPSELLIEYYKTLIPHKSDFLEKQQFKSINIEQLSQTVENETFEIAELNDIKQIEWHIPIRDSEKNKRGSISCISYPGFERYKDVYYGKSGYKVGGIYQEKVFIRRCYSDEYFYGLEISFDNRKEIIFPWSDTRLVHFS